MAGITRQRLKELVKEVMVEETEYQAFFQKALDKAGKSIPSMSDDEKKAFFDKIDSAWNGKGEKNEELVGGQTKLDVDKDGDIGGDDLADLRAGKKVNEGRYDSDLDKIEAAVKNATSFMNVGSELKKAGIKYDFTTSMIPMYMIKVSGNTIAICNKKYAAGAEREVKDIAIGLLEGIIKEARDAAGNEFPEYDDVKAAVKKAMQSDAVEQMLRGRVVAYLQKERGFTGAGNTNSQRLFDKVINDLLKH